MEDEQQEERRPRVVVGDAVGKAENVIEKGHPMRAVVGVALREEARQAAQ